MCCKKNVIDSANFTQLNMKLPKGYMWSGVRLTNIEANTRRENLCLEVWTKTGKAVKRKEKQERAKEKPKFHNARRLRGICFTHREDGEYQETVKNAVS